MIDDPFGDAVRWVRDGGMLAYPTETVWGLGVDAGSERALARLCSWKGRAAHMPISILVPDVHVLELLDFAVDAGVRRLTAEFWPGPLTLVLACGRRFAPGVARGDGAVGVRCSAHPLAAALARRLAREGVGPLTSTSLNRSGAPSARNRREAIASCCDGIEAPRMLGVDGAEAGGGHASTVVDLTGARPAVLRWGALPEPLLGPVLKEIAAS
ncbi:MAG: L-threonylcarbamoyladenylate synthase [Myxococcales bacterium]|nr:L-threonylcarbamoyladenylate synthase [Myxococcales bacterium]MDH5306986.1 L-threonylcarbamoyladenylate synthase [Myxococcales bacterium]